MQIPNIQHMFQWFYSNAEEHGDRGALISVTRIFGTCLDAYTEFCYT